MAINSVNQGFVPLPTDRSADGAGKTGTPAHRQPFGRFSVDPMPPGPLGSVKRGDEASTHGLEPPDTLDEPAATRLANRLGSLGDAEVSADIYSFMALFQKIAQSMRNSARMERATELQAQVSAMQNAAEQMKTTAALRFAGAVVQGAMQIAGGVAQMGFASASAASTIKGANAEAAGSNLVASKTPANVIEGNKQIALGKADTATGLKQSSYGTASSGITAGIGGIISSGLTYGADLSDAQKAKLDAQAKVHETAVQHAYDMMNQMMEVIRDVRDKLQAIQQAAIETSRGIARNI